MIPPDAIKKAMTKEDFFYQRMLVQGKVDDIFHKGLGPQRKSMRVGIKSPPIPPAIFKPDLGGLMEFGMAAVQAGVISINLPAPELEGEASRLFQEYRVWFEKQIQKAGA